MKLSIRQNKLVNVYRYTKISVTVILGFGGTCSLIIEIKPTKANIIAEIDAIRSASEGPCMKIAKLIAPSSQRGKKMVPRVTVGSLYTGI